MANRLQNFLSTLIDSFSPCLRTEVLTLELFRGPVRLLHTCGRTISAKSSIAPCLLAIPPAFSIARSSSSVVLPPPLPQSVGSEKLTKEISSRQKKRLAPKMAVAVGVNRKEVVIGNSQLVVDENEDKVDLFRRAGQQRVRVHRSESEPDAKKERYPASWYSVPRASDGSTKGVATRRMVVPWDVLNTHWRDALRKYASARWFFDENLTPETFTRTFFLSVNPTKIPFLCISEGRISDTDPTTIFLDVTFLKLVFEALSILGVAEDVLRRSFNEEWLQDPVDLKNFWSKPCEGPSDLHQRMKELSLTARSPSSPTSALTPATHATPLAVASAPFLPHLPLPTPSSSSRESSAELCTDFPVPSVSKRRRMDDHSHAELTTPRPFVELPVLATPAPSLESSPEPLMPKSLKVEDTKFFQGMQRDLRLMQREWPLLKSGAGSFFAIDVELWEFDKTILTEFGFASLVYGPGGVKQYETRHFVVKENAHRRNYKYVKDARDGFGYGKSLSLSQSTIFALFESLFDVYSATGPLFLLFHDPRVDLNALTLLGFEPSRFKSLDSFDQSKGGGGIYIVDTQRLYAASVGKSDQKSLGHCAQMLGLETSKLHNAGNDAKTTLDVAECILSGSHGALLD